MRSAISRRPRPLIPGRRRSAAPAISAGFSLAEVLVAGLVIVALVIASARLLSTSLAGGQQIARRQQVEAEIASDLQRIRQEDQTLQNTVTGELNTSSTASPSACSDPAGTLKQNVDAALPLQGGASGRWSRRTVATASGLLQVTYSLQLPGRAGTETRVVEISPLIQDSCLERSLGVN